MNQNERLFRNGVKVDNLYRAIRDSQAVDLVPKLVRQIIDEEMWREHFYEKTGETFRFSHFISFIEKHPPDGLGTSIENLIRLCIDSPETIDLLDRIIQDELKQLPADQVKDKKKASSPTSSRQVALRRLRKLAETNDRIRLLRDSVLSGEMSLNAAMVAAGIRKRRISIPEDIAGATKSLKRRYSLEQIQEFINLLSDDNQ